ncbi:hypothetical protein BU16DRAFT_524339 [Lophium mytilinum]|uniref:Uncharacterized protein n=1 Tax=Lophium mytilinum TaxID=390894 RepID=A0A6A6R1C9_9PEZI|nr:hypothetical protein BU16DRAFT_524339 [Lophium mytilinum]
MNLRIPCFQAATPTTSFKYIYIPLEVLRDILKQAVLERGLQRGLRLRLVNKLFSQEVEQAVFATDLLESRKCAKSSKDMPKRVYHSYLLSRIFQEEKTSTKITIISAIRTTAQTLCRRNGISDHDYTARRAYLEALCFCCDRQLPLTEPIWSKARVGPSNRNSFVIVDAPLEYNITVDAMVAAAYMGFLDLVKILFEEIKRFPEAREPSGGTICGHVFGCPAKAAAKQGQYHVLEFLLGEIDFSSNGPLWSAYILGILNTAAETCNPDLLRAAIYAKNGAHHDAIVPRAWTRRSWVAPVDFFQLEYLIAFNGISGRDIFIQLWDLPSPFDSDRKINIASKFDPGAFHRFINRTTAVVKYLLQPQDSRSFREQNPSVRNADNTVELYWLEACLSGTPELVSIFLARGSEPTPHHLHQTISKGQLVKTRLLLEHGLKLEPAKPRYTLKADGISCVVEPTPPIIFVVQLEHTDFFDLLRQHGAVLGNRAISGLALRLAAEKGLESMVRLLLSEGVPVHGARCGLSPFGPFKGPGNTKKMTYIEQGVRRLLVDAGGLNMMDDMTDRSCPYCES